MKTCQTCEIRHEGCHAHCDIYAYEKRQHDRQQAKIRQSRELYNNVTGFIVTSITPRTKAQWETKERRYPRYGY